MDKQARPKTHDLMHEFMTNFQHMDKDEQSEMWDKLNTIVESAKLDVIEDAEKQIEKLRTFSL